MVWYGLAFFSPMYGMSVPCFSVVFLMCVNCLGLIRPILVEAMVRAPLKQANILIQAKRHGPCSKAGRGGEGEYNSLVLTNVFDEIPMGWDGMG